MDRRNPILTRGAMDVIKRSLSLVPSMGLMTRGSSNVIQTQQPTGLSLLYSKHYQPPRFHPIINPTHSSMRTFSQGPPNGMNLGNIFNHAKNQTPKQPGETLAQYGIDLTALAKESKLDPVIGRHEEIRRTLQILARRTKNNPVLIGEPGEYNIAVA